MAIVATESGNSVTELFCFNREDTVKAVPVPIQMILN